MLFNFQKFIKNLALNPEKKEVVEKYEKLVHPISDKIEEQKWYKDYVSKLEPVKYKVSEVLKNDYDWDLLIRLVASSFSSVGHFRYIEGILEFEIDVETEDQKVIKNVTDLWGFQILRLYEIYCEEQMNLEILIHEDYKEKAAIMAQREKIISRWNLQIQSIPLKKSVSEIEIKINSIVSSIEL